MARPRNVKGSTRPGLKKELVKMKFPNDDQKRISFKAYNKKLNEVIGEHRGLFNFSSELPEVPVYPDECIGLTCGARTRAGTPCKRKDLYESGRCRLHGGLSTGPTSEAGKKRSALNGLRPKKNKRTP